MEWLIVGAEHQVAAVVSAFRSEGVVIRFRSPDEVPHGCFHPRSRYHGFRVEGTYWSTVTQYCLAQRLASPKDREHIRTQARDPEHAEAMAASMPAIDGWQDQAEEALRRALLLSFEQNLWIRAVLVATGDQPIVAELEAPVLGVGSDGTRYPESS